MSVQMLPRKVHPSRHGIADGLRGEELRLFAERLQAAVSYDPDTGLFTSRVSRGAMRAGKVLGGADAYGYIRFSFEKKDYKAHRLAWLVMTGEWPEHGVDHRDCDRTNNRWANLRAADQSQNTANSPLSKRNTSGLKGAHFAKGIGKWTAHICVKRKQMTLGTYATAEEAHAAYLAAAKKYFGEFARAS